ncbi:MAG: hypothetical protein ACR2QH_19865 [Geminicoccaceae bacterium]
MRCRFVGRLRRRLLHREQGASGDPYLIGNLEEMIRLLGFLHAGIELITDLVPAVGDGSQGVGKVRQLIGREKIVRNALDIDYR